MKDFLKRFLGCLLVLATCVGSQVVCPMMLFPQWSHACGSQHSAASVPEANQGTGHACCPRKAAHRSSSPGVEDHGSVMSCCSVPAQPASSTQPTQPDVDMVIVGHVGSAVFQLPSADRSLEIPDCGPPLRGILNLKEDLRI